MTAKEKAKELVQKMKLATDEFGYININMERHKQCALIAVDEIINSVVITDLTTAENQFIYWGIVKNEIEKM